MPAPITTAAATVTATGTPATAMEPGVVPGAWRRPETLTGRWSETLPRWRPEALTGWPEAGTRRAEAGTRWPKARRPVTRARQRPIILWAWRVITRLRHVVAPAIGLGIGDPAIAVGIGIDRINLGLLVVGTTTARVRRASGDQRTQ